MKLNSSNALQSSRSGVTLLEVLVATVLFSTGVMMVAQGITVAIRAEAQACDQAVALRLADLTLARVEIEELPHNQSSEDSFEEEGYPEFSYEIESESGEDPDLFLVTVRILWERATRDRELVIEREFYRPVGEEE
jgi:type II secretion system protein I